MKDKKTIVDFFPEIEEAHTIASKAGHWFIQNVLTWQSVLQILVIFSLAFVSWALSRKMSSWAQKNATGGATFYTLIEKFRLPLAELSLIVILPLLLWLSLPFATMVHLNTTFLRVAANLLSAWALIRISSTIIKSGFWSNTVAFFLWVVAALNILDWLDPAIKMLDGAVLSVGAIKISLLMVARGAFVFFIFLWVASIFSSWLEKALRSSRSLTPSQKVLFHKSARIVLIVGAIILGLNALGIDLTALAVFSGALGIGIGFGLQKVFSNLVSGFILLMDKSIKPGDVIAIANTYGWVNRLGARYVSILTRDGKEHLIPNENMIVERVENWSYSNSAIRIRIPVGVSYAADIDAVKKILLDAADGNERVLKTHAPTCLITGFGDNAVDYELRVWIEDPVNGIANVTSALYEVILKTFKAQNIEIPFPQRDIHIKTENLPQILEALRAAKT